MSALERAQEDIQRGDYGLARQRLTSLLVNKGYDAELAARIGWLSYDMRDLYQAGRYWLLADAEGGQVDEAIDLFLKRSGSEPRVIVGQLPRTLRLSNLDDYPEPVRRRLRRLGLEEAMVLAARSDPGASRASWSDRATTIGCLAAALGLLAILLIGLGTLVHWLFF